ncbi:MAG: HIT family protein [Candidatus Rokuibacteriota bacterium]
MDCVFCKIRDGQIPSFKIFEDSKTLAFMDINPLSPGHCLVISKSHAATIFDVEVLDLQAAVATTKRVASAVKLAVRADGINILQANGSAAFQSVPHFHFHVIPRFNNDGKGFDWKLVPGDKQQIGMNGERIRSVLR